MSRDFDIVSLDLETSGDNPEKHTILSIGCVRLSDSQSFYAEVRHDSFEMSSEAARIHKLNLTDRDRRDLPTMSQVDLQLRDWLKQSQYYQEGKSYTLVPLGFNVGSFDMQFVHKYLPKSAALLGYRTIDLNALLFVDALAQGIKFHDAKRAAKTIGQSYAIHHVPTKEAHDALWDAWLNIGVFNYLVHDELAKLGEITFEGGNI